ncbi:FAD-dependent oxidoreductase [Tepidimicrobium xylanilyticum]|uniref:NADPH-dependent glutamate synthase beta chain n=1 Tax=Tepidimicrobium xylanilyticum TaxID=1123352 RepID=A0A1H2TEQ4_9FIRM|nr:FAD-dependent oxidoreductase [Tepidimicrobium xylanilyticum]GMG95961.1 pyridine nucleotide-disulfide oxidoreductase [Tepidimicrobium xylanilyticum]SDW42426.1 NADPH-dependent glutamate synthase beta chain [Tepidimicrobium xylanilyticum]
MVKQKVLDLANHIGMKKPGSKSAYKPTDPEYMILEPVVTDEMAEVGLCLEFRKPKSAEEVAPLCGKSIEETEKLLWELAMAGVCFVNKIDGVDKYWLDTWVPGVMEMMVNNKENVRKYPQIAEAFEAYGRIRGPMTAGNFPVGKGLMRVIPIETAIDGETRRASYEEISKYLNEHEIFSVSDCSCRTSREIMGEGCGHLKEDMCIQLGHAAEYYIRTGRGRQITREEAFEIIRKAEENGLMHQIPNVDGPGKTHAICNCCSCSCFSLRTATMFLNNDMIRSNYVSRVNPEKCVACGQCVQVCPTNALKLGQKLCGEIQVIEERIDLPSNSEWGPDKWNPDYRTNRKHVLDSGTSPCITKCPAHIPVQGYIKLASQGRYTEALELIKKENPFPAVCGRICPRPCESACTRGNVDEPIAIDDIKKFIAEQDLNADIRYIPKKRHDYGKKIAIIGSGPSGLSCAYYLAIDGYKVTVFEKQEVLGGMLTLGIPSYRLEKDVINAEIDILRELGVEFKTGVEVGKDITLDELRKEGYEAFYLAIGAQAGRKLGVEGEDIEGVISGVDFLRNVNLGKDPDIEGDVVVIGGGNVAIDVARTATRAGAASVQMYCLESREEMPALEEEIEEAISEDIVINNGWGPKRILTENNKVVGIELKRCISVFDGNGRFNPKYDENDTIVVKADRILLSIGQRIDWGKLLEGSKAELNPNNTIKVDPITLQTGEPDIFAGGDAATGPKFAIDAIALGKEAAISIHRFVHPGQDLIIGRDRREFKAFDKEYLDLEGYDRIPRQRTKPVDGSKAKQSFRDLRPTLTEEQVRKETERCLSCGVTVVDEYMCIGCGQCTTKCKFDAISLVRKYDEANVSFEELKPIIVKNVVKRKGRIVAHKVKKVIRGKKKASVK